MIVEHLQPAARFELSCETSAVAAAPIPDGIGRFRAYDGPPLDRREVAVVVLLRPPNRCCSPNSAQWMPYIVSIDQRRKLMGPHRKTGEETLRGFPDQYWDRCKDSDECLRIAIMPGVHLIKLKVWTWGSVSPDRKETTRRGSAEFDAVPGGLYSIHACHVAGDDQPRFWVRDEVTATCVSRRCPET
jgi:hypothetical protein